MHRFFVSSFQTLMKVSRSEHAVLEQGREVIQKELEEETNERLRKIKRSILEPLQGSASILSMGNMERRKKYASMTAAEVVLEVFTNAEGVFAPRMARVGALYLRFASPASATEICCTELPLSFTTSCTYFIVLTLVRHSYTLISLKEMSLKLGSLDLFFSRLSFVCVMLSSLLLSLSLQMIFFKKYSKASNTHISVNIMFSV